jgi:hypothetical protein
MQLVRLAFQVGLLAVAVWVAWTCIQVYATETGTFWERMLKTARDSATLLWARFCMLVAGVVANIDTAADFLGVPELKPFIDTWLGSPKIIAGVMLLVSMITIAARKRTM